MIKFIKKHKDYFFLTILTLLFFFLILLVTGCLFGNITLISGDTRQQYLALFTQLKEILTGNQNIFYAWNKGIGGSFLGTFFYYLSSPLNLFVLFFEEKYFYYFLLFLFAIKSLFATLSMYCYLKRHFSISTYFLFMFSILYAFSSYAIGYVFNIMWLDALYLLPLVLIGIEKLIDKKQIGFYTLFLFLTIFSNYYIGYMVCLFSVFYFFYYLFIHYSWKTQKKEIKKICLLFFTVSFLTGMLCAFFLLPCGFEFLNSSHTLTLNKNANVLKVDNWNFLSYFFLNGSKNIEVLNYSHYYIYAGIIVFPLCILYFFHKNISKKEKIATGFLFFIFFISFLVPPIDKIWHLFSNPMAYAGRYTFLFVFFSIVIATKSFQNIHTLENKYFMYIAPIFPIVGLFLYLIGTTSIWMVYVNVAGYLIYLLILFSLKKDKTKELSYFLFILVIAEAFFHSTYTLQILTKEMTRKDEIEGYYTTYQEEIDAIKSENNLDFYRVYDGHDYMKNSGMFMHFNGIDIFLSATDNHLMRFFKKISYSDDLQSTFYNPTNNIINSILNVQYLIVEGKEENGVVSLTEHTYQDYPILYHHSIKIGNSYLYGVTSTDSYVIENPYVLPLGFSIAPRSKFAPIDSYIDTYDLSNILLNSMLEEDINVYEEIYPEQVEENAYKIKFQKDEQIFLMVKAKNDDSLTPTFSIDGNDYRMYGKSGRIEMEIPYKKDEFIFTCREEEKKDLEFHFYRFDKEKMNEKIKELRQNSLSVVKKTNIALEGNISVEENKVLFLSLLNEKGWTAYVDGKKQKIIPLYETFIGLDLEPGNHTIVLKYETPFFKVGCIISILSLLSLIFIKKVILKKF